MTNVGLSSRNRAMLTRAWKGMETIGLFTLQCAKWLLIATSVAFIYYFWCAFAAEAIEDDVQWIAVTGWLLLLPPLWMTGVACWWAVDALRRGAPIAHPVPGERLLTHFARQFILAACYLAIGGLFAFALLAFALGSIDGLSGPWGKSEAPSYNATVTLFAWHMADLVPLADLTTTLGWTEPLRSRGLLVSLPLAGYKIIVLTPAVAVLAGVVRRGGFPATVDRDTNEQCGDTQDAPQQDTRMVPG